MKLKQIRQIVSYSVLVALFTLTPFFSLPTAQAQTTTTKYLNGKITFYSARDGISKIYAMNPDGSSQASITNGPDDYVSSYSPDGTKITFTSDRSGSSEIYSMNADGSNLATLTNTSGSNRVSSWSPDGSKIVFHSTRDSNFEIYSMNADGTNQTRLTTNVAQDSTPAWSPDGSKIAFFSDRDGNFEIYTMNADGTNQTNITTNAASDYGAAWSPDGARIAFISDRNSPPGGPYNEDIYTMNPDGSNVTRITNSVGEEESASYSPDGTKLAATVYPDETYASSEVFTMNIDGTGRAQLTNTGGSDATFSPQAWQPLPYTETVNDDGSVTSTISSTQLYSATDYTVVSGETLILDGSLCDVTVESGGTLMGTGTACTITVEPGGIIAPGHSPGCIMSGNLSLSGTFVAELAGTTACSGYDQLQVTGTVAVGGNLNVSLLNGFAPAAGNTFTLIANDATDPVTGTFIGLAEGSTITIGTSRFTISYVGGDGNDVTLTALASLPGLPVTGSEPIKAVTELFLLPVRASPMN